MPTNAAQRAAEKIVDRLAALQIWNPQTPMSTESKATQIAAIIEEEFGDAEKALNWSVGHAQRYANGMKFSNKNTIGVHSPTAGELRGVLRRIANELEPALAKLRGDV